RTRHGLHGAAQGRAGAGGGGRRDGDAGRGGRRGARRGRGRRIGDRARSVAHATVGLEERPQGLTAAVSDSSKPADSKTRLLVASATFYVVWGSTYLAIRIAVEHWPPLWMAAVRFAIAGGGL